MKKTLWKHWFGKKQEKIEQKLIQPFNPLNAKIDSSVTLNIPNFNGPYKIESITEVTCINNQKHKFIDYCISATFLLRVYPDGKILLLEFYDSLDFDKNLLKICQESKEFHVTDKVNNNEEVYYRVGNLGKPHICIAKYQDEYIINNSYSIEYWDYSKTTKNEVNQGFEQFLFVEMDKESGSFQIWRGNKIQSSMVTVI